MPSMKYVSCSVTPGMGISRVRVGRPNASAEKIPTVSTVCGGTGSRMTSGIGQVSAESIEVGAIVWEPSATATIGVPNASAEASAAGMIVWSSAAGGSPPGNSSAPGYTVDPGYSPAMVGTVTVGDPNASPVPILTAVT